jgi:2,3-bisphosphoglycerate-dependent phosphoglycerate mutase
MWRDILFVFILLISVHTADASQVNLVIVRHGQAAHNIADVYNSNPSSPNYKPSDLTEEGKKQTNATAKTLLDKGINDTNIEAVYVSPLPRTQETAEIMVQAGLFSKNKIHTDPRLTEVQIGDLEGKPIIHDWKNEFAVRYHTETDEQVQKRVTEFYDSLVASHPQANIVVITHGVPAQKLMALVCKNPEKLATGQAVVCPLILTHH